jgi:class 3 adenylate cyclase
MRLSIQSKMIVGLLLLSLTAASITGFLGYRSGKQALNDSILERLTAVRTAKSNQVISYLKFIRGQVLSYSEGLMVVQGTKDFSAAFAKLKEKKLTPEQDAELRQYYTKEYMPALLKHVDAKPQIVSVYPSSEVARYLQYQYLVKNPNPEGKKDLLREASDGTEYSQVHAKYHEIVNNFKNIFGYEDIMIVEPENLHVIYSTTKQIDFGTSFSTGPFSKTALAEVLEELARERDKDVVRLVDYEPYRPAYGLPAAFMASPVFDGMEMVGILVAQFPIKRINDIVSGNGHWKEDGLGDTGEVYLVGDDRYMRNESRHFTQDPKNYVKRLAASGFSKEQVEKTERYQTSILTVKLASEAIDNIFMGRTGIGVVKDYLGVEVLSSYSPLEFEGLRWGIVAKVPTQEAFAPVRQFTRDLLSSLATIGLCSSLIAAVIGGAIARPVRKLIHTAAALAKGNYEARVSITSRDEFADLARTFNKMASEIESQKKRVEEKIRENEKLLESMLPAPVAARLRSGPSELSSDSHADVSVVFGSVHGFDSFSEGLTPARALELLNQLIVAFDEAAEKHCVEKLKSIGASYLAVCGLSVPRFDHSQRAVAFALEMDRIVRKFNADNGSNLLLNVGVHRGPVTGGIIGRNKFIYDLWGRTIDIARSLGENPGEGVIRISKEVYERVADLHDCEMVRMSQAKGDYVYLVDTSEPAAPRGRQLESGTSPEGK